MFAKFRDWLDARTNYRKLMAALLLEHIPGGAKWRYVWGSTLSFVFFIQLVTGVLLMTAYSPGDTSAWSSVYFIQYEMDFGWFIRGLHHFGSQTMVVLLAVHMLQVVIAGAHLPPREVNWWLGLLLLGVVLGLSLTGYLLPWDQKGFWATRVATNIAGTLPLLGPEIAKFAVGGPEYGNATLTRFFALHVAILPPLMIVLIIAHIAVFRRQGIATVEPVDHPKQGVFWPDQVFKDLVACLVVFGILVSLVVFGGHGNKIESAEGTETAGLYEDWAKAGRKGLGANLDAPADRAAAGYPARPEWYFLFLFQLLKYFEGPQMIVGTVIIPQGVGVLLFLLPFLGYGKMRRFGHIAGVLVVSSLITGVGVLTCLALADDTLNPVLRELMTLLGLVVVPVIGGVFLLHMALLAVIPRNVFRMVVYGLGVVVLAILLGGSGLLIYAAQADDERFAHLEEGQKNLEVKDKEAPKEKVEPEDKEAVKKKEEDQKIAALMDLVKSQKHDDKDVLPRQVWDYVQEELQKKWGSATREQMLGQVKKQEEIEKFHHSLKEAKELAVRAVFQASRGIPSEGPIYLVRNDPMVAGRKLFGTYCASCHSYTNPKTDKAELETPKGGFTASDLGGFGNKQWMLGMILHSDKDKYFGRIIRITEAKNEKIKEKKKKLPVMETMAGKSADFREMLEQDEKKLKDPGTPPEEKERIAERMKDFDRLAAWLVRQQTEEGPKDEQEKKEFAVALQAFKRHCAECHRHGEEGGQSGPNLTGYGSAKWARLMVMAPIHSERYPKKNAMPAFRNLDPKDPGAEVYEQEFKLLHQDRAVAVIAVSDIERELILRFMLQDDRVIFGGRPISGPPKKQ